MYINDVWFNVCQVAKFDEFNAPVHQMWIIPYLDYNLMDLMILQWKWNWKWGNIYRIEWYFPVHCEL